MLLERTQSVLLATYDLGDALLTTLAIFFFVIWIWIVITILMDIFRDHELSGWWKAVWCLFLIFIPVLTSLIYLIARGSGMRDRAIKEQADAKKHFDEYVKETAAPSSPVDELHKLDQVRTSGGITDEEYATLKAKILA
jgi:Phospholipase_D-nuclease N-terminal